MLRFLDRTMLKARTYCYDFFQKENGELNIVTIVILIGIAVILAVMFKDFIGNLLNTLFGGIEDNAKDALNIIE